MSGLIGAIGKIFTPVVSGLSASVGSGVAAVGATVATAGAATGGGLLGGLAQAGFRTAASGLTGTLGSVISGAAKAMATGVGAGLMGAAAPGALTTAMGMAPSIVGGMGTNVVKGMAGSDTPTGMAPAADDSWFGPNMKEFLGSEGFAGLVGGLGEGYMKQAEMDAERERQERELAFLRDKEQRLQDSYNIGAGALPDGASTGVVRDTARPTPTQAWYWQWDPAANGVVRKQA